MNLENSDSGPGLLKFEGGLELPLSTERLTLRAFQLGDQDALYELHSSEEVGRYTGGTRSPDESLGSLKRMMRSIECVGFGTLAVTLTATGECVGYCGVRPLINTPDWELAYGLNRRHWGRGYATEAARACIHATLQGLLLDRVVAVVHRENSASIRVLEKLGMSYVGEVYAPNPYYEADFYEISRDKWMKSD